jgi:hypothetical protein
MNWIKQNWFKLGILLLLFAVVLLGFFYFFFSWIPAHKAISALKNQEQCRIVGEKAFKADADIYGSTHMIEPQYTFNEKLNTCIYSSGYSFENSSSGKCGDILTHACDAQWERWVKNTYTNDKIIDVFNSTDKNGEWLTKDETINDFWDEYEKLFGHR